MGYNTTVVVMNDSLDHIKQDFEFGTRLANAIQEVAAKGKPVEVPSFSKGGGAWSNAATVIETHPADNYVTVRVGRNRGVVVNDEIDSDEVARLMAENEEMRKIIEYAHIGFGMAYESANKKFNDEVLLCCGHHEARLGNFLDRKKGKKT